MFYILCACVSVCVVILCRLRAAHSRSHSAGMRWGGGQQWLKLCLEEGDGGEVEGDGGEVEGDGGEVEGGREQGTWG